MFEPDYYGGPEPVFLGDHSAPPPSAGGPAGQAIPGGGQYGGPTAAPPLYTSEPYESAQSGAADYSDPALLDLWAEIGATWFESFIVPGATDPGGGISIEGPFPWDPDPFEQWEKLNPNFREYLLDIGRELSENANVAAWIERGPSELSGQYLISEGYDAVMRDLAEGEWNDFFTKYDYKIQENGYWGPSPEAVFGVDEDGKPLPLEIDFLIFGGPSAGGYFSEGLGGFVPGFQWSWGYTQFTQGFSIPYTP